MILQQDVLEIANQINNCGIRNKTILITGATGLIGSLLTKGFLCANEEFFLNNKIYALVRNEDKANEVFKDYINYKFIILKKDITQPIDIECAVDFIYHTAAITTSKLMVSNPVEVIDVSINGSKNIFDFALKHNTESVVYLSSMEVYGVVDAKNKLKENELGYLDLSNARSCYPESKRLVENLCLCYVNEYNLNVKIARLTQTFGAGVAYEEQKVYNMIAKSAIENKNIVLSTKGESVRDYCYTTDAINAILLISVKGNAGECYNVANEDTNMSIYDMAQMVAKDIANNKIKVNVNLGDNSKYMAPSIIKLDTSKLKSLGWEPKYGLKEMYERLIKSYDNIK